MNCIKSLKAIRSKKNTKLLTSTQTTNSYNLVAKNITIQTKPNTSAGKEKLEGSTDDSNHYYELMGMDSNFEKCKKKQSKIQIKPSPIKNSKLKRGKMGSFGDIFLSTKTQEFKSEENFQSKDTLVPAHLSSHDLKQISLFSYEQQTGIHKLPKITDTKGDDYYLLDINPTTI